MIKFMLNYKLYQIDICVLFFNQLMYVLGKGCRN